MISFSVEIVAILAENPLGPGHIAGAVQRMANGVIGKELQVQNAVQVPGKVIAHRTFQQRGEAECGHSKKKQGSFGLFLQGLKEILQAEAMLKDKPGGVDLRRMLANRVRQRSGKVAHQRGAQRLHGLVGKAAFPPPARRFSAPAWRRALRKISGAPIPARARSFPSSLPAPVPAPPATPRRPWGHRCCGCGPHTPPVSGGKTPRKFLFRSRDALSGGTDGAL